MNRLSVQRPRVHRNELLMVVKTDSSVEVDAAATPAVQPATYVQQVDETGPYPCVRNGPAGERHYPGAPISTELLITLGDRRTGYWSIKSNSTDRTNCVQSGPQT